MHSTGLEGNQCQNCLWPCPRILLICCSAPVWVSKSSGLCLSAASPQAGCQPSPAEEQGSAQQDALGAGWPRVLLAAAPAPMGSTVPAGGHRAQVTRWGTRAASHCSWGPVALAGHTHSSGVPTAQHSWASHTTVPVPPAHHWHAARPTGDRTTQHWNEHNLSFNWG